jgi:hypothetical protein
MIDGKSGLPGNGMENGLSYTDFHKRKHMDSAEQMEDRLWDFIDGRSSPEEQALVRKLITDDPEWKRLHNEFMRVDLAMNRQELDAPSLRFTKNVMEQIARYHVAPATKNYIDRNVIRGITAFFLVMIIGILVYFIGQFHWVATSTDNLVSSYHLDANKLGWGKLLNDSSVNIFILVNVVLGFTLLDRYLQGKKKLRNHGEAV